MQALIAAIIAASAAIVSAIVAGVFGSKKTNHLVEKNKLKIGYTEKTLSKEHEGLSKEHEGLSKEHEGLSKEHNGLSKEHQGILEKMKDVGSDVDGVHKLLIEEKTRQEYRYETLTEKQRNIVGSIQSIQQLGEELQRVQAENTRLRQAVAALQNELSHLRENRNAHRAPSRGDDGPEPEL